MIIEIGDKPIKDISPEDLLQIVIIEGCCPVIMLEGEKIWNEPIITDFDNKMFSDTIVLDYTSYRVCDNLKSADYIFFFDWKDFHWHYTKDFKKGEKQDQKQRNRVRLETIRYLISKGYDVPIYNNA